MAWFHAGEQLSSLPDQELIERYRNSRDAQYIGELYQRYVHIVLNIGNLFFNDRTQTEPLVHQVLAQLQQDLKSKNIPNFREWLWKTILHLCRENSDASLPPSAQLAPAFTVNFQLYKDEYTTSQQQQIEKAIEHLPEQEQQLLHLFYKEQRSLSEIMERLQQPFDEVIYALQQAKRNVITHLQQKGS